LPSKRIAIVLIGLAGATGCSRKTTAPPPPDPSAELRSLADEYFDQVYFRYAPSNGTADGFHQYDAQLEDYSRAAVDRETADLKRFEEKFDAIPASIPAEFPPAHSFSWSAPSPLPMIVCAR